MFQLVLTTRPTAEEVHAEMSKHTNLAVTLLSIAGAEFAIILAGDPAAGATL